jgi:hypothetical protein
MDFIKNFNQTIKHLKEKHRKDLTTLLPEELNIYEGHVLTKNDVIRTNHLDIIHFENQFKQNFSVVFGLSGELEGFAICRSSEDIPRDLFVESMNILIGNYLSSLDENEQIFSGLLAPLLFYPEKQLDEEGKNHFYKFSQRLRLFMQESQTFHANYTMIGEGKFYPITITFILKFKGSEYDWRNF